MRVTEDLGCCKILSLTGSYMQEGGTGYVLVNLKAEKGEKRRESLQILVAVRINPMLYSRSQ
jgi:hypothetical protein|uniref:Uncharacterized protein n=1 Tax=Zea mays TaxID=4577 RepID=B6UED7_MAIZE|nr:hypothetical protein [Zea mays]